MKTFTPQTLSADLFLQDLTGNQIIILAFECETTNTSINRMINRRHDKWEEWRNENGVKKATVGHMRQFLSTYTKNSNYRKLAKRAKDLYFICACLCVSVSTSELFYERGDGNVDDALEYGLAFLHERALVENKRRDYPTQRDYERAMRVQRQRERREEEKKESVETRSSSLLKMKL